MGGGRSSTTDPINVLDCRTFRGTDGPLQLWVHVTTRYEEKYCLST